MQKLLRPVGTNGPRTQEGLPIGVLFYRLMDPIDEQIDHIKRGEISLTEGTVLFVEPSRQFTHPVAAKERPSLLINECLFDIPCRETPHVHFQSEGAKFLTDLDTAFQDP